MTSAEPNGRTALHYAAGYGDGGAIRVLLEANADVNQMDVAGITPVACAALKQQHGVIAVLLAAGADPTLAARQGVWAGRSAVDMARDVGCDRSASALLRHCWCSLLPFEVKMLVFAYLGPSDLGAAALTCSDWCSLVLTGRQLGALPDTPPRSPAWLAHAAALGAKAPAQPPLSPRERSGSVNGRPAAAATLGGRSPGSPRAGSPAPPVPPPPSSPAGGSSGRKRPCLVLDLDETLVHASAVPVPGCDFSFTFSFAGGVHTMYVRRRPFLDFFFNHLLVSGAWEVVIFTASVQAYADAMLDLLDPKGERFARRLHRHVTPHLPPRIPRYRRALRAEALPRALLPRRRVVCEGPRSDRPRHCHHRARRQHAALLRVPTRCAARHSPATRRPARPPRLSACHIGAWRGQPTVFRFPRGVTTTLIVSCSHCCRSSTSWRPPATTSAPFSRAAAASSKSWSGGVPTSCSHRCWRRPSSSPPPPPQTAAAAAARRERRRAWRGEVPRSSRAATGRPPPPRRRPQACRRAIVA